MKAFIYPGQASQYVGMGQDLFETYTLAKERFAEANEILGYDLTDYCFNGPEEKLKQTYITQPAIFVHSCIVTELLAEKGLSADMAAGHSLGEYSALVAAGALAFRDALQLVKVRGRAMQEAGEKNPGTMAAIIGMDDSDVEALCAKASEAGIVQPANFNSPGQIVISGSEAGIARAVELAPEMGAKRAVPLVVGGAFHSPLMAGAQDELREAIETAPFRDARLPVYSNVRAEPVTAAAEIRELLNLQLTHPVRWTSCMLNMIRDGAEEFYEVGPGKVLTGLGRRIDRKKMPKSVDTVADIENIGA
ncbi:MAG TPA: [acyl-carrier-protein] S-malonyltransferase [Bacteroidetes bacterium]|nr:[acyl-carrier-protein] S-malonyltransferase [Bacteroidota bacterium]